MRYFRDRNYQFLGFALTKNTSKLANPIGCFAGRTVRAEAVGPVAALVGEVPRFFRYGSRNLNNKRCVRNDVEPVLSAVSSLIPFVPADPGFEFLTLSEVRRLGRERGREMREVVSAHAGFLQIDVALRFDREQISDTVLETGPLSKIEAQTPLENFLIGRTAGHSVNGQIASADARLRRLITKFGISSAAVSSDAHGSSYRVLLDRCDRAAFRLELDQLGADSVTGIGLKVGAFLPALDFRRISLDRADDKRVARARDILGVAESTFRPNIEIAYRRALERVDPGARHAPFAKVPTTRAALDESFHLLDLVAEGQIRAARGGRDTKVDLSCSSLNKTWLMRFHKGCFPDRAA